MTAMPLVSDDTDAAVGAVFGTRSVAVSAVRIRETGTPSTRDATCRRMVHIARTSTRDATCRRMVQIGQVLVTPPAGAWFI